MCAKKLHKIPFKVFRDSLRIPVFFMFYELFTNLYL